MSNLAKITESEDCIVARAIRNGHLDPREDDRLSLCLTGTSINRKIIDYISNVKVDNLIKANIRFEDIDRAYCKSELLPLIQRKLDKDQKSSGLEFPLFVVRRGKDKFEVVQGHNRLYCLKHYLEKKEVPVFVIEEKGTPSDLLKSKIIPDSRKGNTSREYKMNCVVKQMLDFKKLGHFTNLEDEKNTRQEFDTLMDEIHPHQFIDKGPRGKIFKAFYNNNNAASTLKTVDRSFKAAAVSRNGYVPKSYTTENNRQKDHQFPYWIDDNKKAILVEGKDNDQFFEALIAKFMYHWKTHEEYRKEYKDHTLHFIHIIRNPSPNKSELKKARQEARDKYKVYNLILDELNIPRISTVIFPAQLSSETDDVVYTLE